MTNSQYEKNSQYIIKTASDFAENIKGNASFSYSGWGPTIQASFAH